MTRARSGTVLLAVLVVVTLTVMIVASIALRTDSVLESSRVQTRRVQLRSLAWSGVQAAMNELAAQRDDLIDGGSPTLTQTWTLFQSAGLRGVVELDDMGGATAESELAKLDLNRADAAMLAKIPGVSQPLADAIVAMRSAGEIPSVEHAAAVQGISPELFYGVPDAETPAQSTADAVPLARLITTFGFDPNTQSGPDSGTVDSRGWERVPCSIGWGREIQAELARRLPSGAVAGARAVLRARAVPKPADMVRLMREAGVAPQDWGAVLDVLTAEDDRFLRGRVSLMHAPAAVLACVPGISPEAAGRIAQVRTTLSPETRRRLAWPVTEGILSPEEFEQAVGYLTTRSLVWRVRVRATLVPDAPPEIAATEPRHVPTMIWEAVIDASGVRPRVAYLRDVTFLDAAVRGVRWSDVETDEAGEADGAQEGAPQPSPSPNETETKPTDGGIDRAGSSPETPKNDPVGRRRGGNNHLGPRATLPGFRDGDSKPEPVVRPAPADDGASSPAPRGLQDRRIGRWKTGRSGN